MRILIVSQYFWPEEFRVNDLASELSARGHAVTVLTGIPNYPLGEIHLDYVRNPELFLQYNGAEIVRVPLVARGNGRLRLLLNYVSFAISASTIGAWRLRKIDFDVIFSPQLSPVTAMLASVILKKLRRRRFVMWVLDLWPDTLNALGVVKSPWILRVVQRMVDYIYNQTDILFVQSQGFVDRIIQSSSCKITPQYLPNWSETLPELAEIDLAKEIDFRPDLFNVMFAGAIGDSQDFPTILAAADMLRHETRLRWLIVGDGRVSDWVASEVSKRKLSNVVMLGRYPSSRMPEFYKHADAMLVSLKNEPIFSLTVPGKVQSYFAAGKPVIAMLNGEGAKIVTESQAGVAVAAGNFNELAGAIGMMMALDTVTLKKMGDAAKMYSVRNFNRRHLIDRIERELESLKIVG